MTILRSFLVTILILIASTAIGIALLMCNINERFYIQLIYLSEIIPNLIVYGLVLIYFNVSVEKLKMNWDFNTKKIISFSVIILAFGIQLVDLPFFYWKNISNMYLETTFQLTDYSNYRFETFQLYKIFSVLIVAPFFEEVIFRYYFFGRLLKTYNFLTAILTSSILFSIIHISSPRNLIPSFYFGLVSSFIYYKTKNISYSFLFHLSYNLLWTLTFIYAREYNIVIAKIGFGGSFLFVFLIGISLCYLGTKQISKSSQIII